MKTIEEIIEEYKKALNYLALVENGQNQYNSESKVWKEYQVDVDIAKDELKKAEDSFKEAFTLHEQKIREEIEDRQEIRILELVLNEIKDFRGKEVSVLEQRISEIYSRACEKYMLSKNSLSTPPQDNQE